MYVTSENQLMSNLNCFMWPKFHFVWKYVAKCCWGDLHSLHFIVCYEHIHM